jgi:hypothetical protein
MASKKQLQLAYGLAIILFVVGVLSYAYTAFSAKPLDQPVRLMFDVVAGKVIFDHKTHTDDSGYGIACIDCHHTSEEDETNPDLCGDCHETPSDDEEVPNRADSFHLQCTGCHEAVEAGPLMIDEDCALCHVL